MARKKRTRRVKISDRLAIMLEAKREAFIEKFGREPGEGDPVFYDLDEDTPVQMSVEKFMAHWVVTAIRAETPTVFIYAFIRTGGLVVSDDTADMIPKEDLALWDQATEEYWRNYGDD
jgi:hypothetical protein